MQEPIQIISTVVCFATVVALLFRIRQSHEDDRVFARCLMLAMGSLALGYFYKGWQRIDGDMANMIDLWRELSLLAVLALRVNNVCREHGRL